MQRRRTIKARALKKADRVVRFLFIDKSIDAVAEERLYLKHVKKVKTFRCRRSFSRRGK
jgi:hypothetical protein